MTGTGCWTSDGDRAVKFMERLKLTGDFTGQPLILRPFQEDLVRKLFGTKNPDGKRVYRRCFLMLPRKNFKTETCAAIATTSLLGMGREGQSIILAASDRYQASILFDRAEQMIRQSKALMSRCRIRTAKKQIVCPKTFSELKVISSEGRRQLGASPSLVLIDELLAQPNRELWDALTSSFGARQEPLLIAITTQTNRKESLCYEEYLYAKAVQADPSLDPSYLPIIYEASPEDDWTSEKTWQACNPAWSDLLRDFYQSELVKAQQIPAEETKFKQFYLNLLVTAVNRFVNPEKWTLCGKGLVEAEKLKGRVCYAGLDVSNTSDITAFVLCFEVDGDFKVLCWFWLPSNYAKKRQERDGIPYLRWAANKANNLKLTTGLDPDVIDHDEVIADILKICREYKVKQINVDPYNATQIVLKLKAQRLKVEAFRQGTLSMNAPLKDLTVNIAYGKVHHGNNEVLTWMSEQACIVTDAMGNWRLDREDQKVKIDGIAAMAMAFATCVENQKKPCIWNNPNASIF